MHSIRSNGDSIAHEFFRIMDNNQTLKKVAQEEENNLSEYSDVVADSAFSENEVADLLVDNEASDVVDNNVEDVTNQIDDFESYAEDDGKLTAAASSTAAGVLPEDPYGQYIMSGLGKIAASLRSKGEGFAADVVEATAFSIRGDLVKESKRKTGIISSLSKMATDFCNSGDNFAADMVKTTINKISR